MQKLSRKDQFFVGVTLFSMFFGAGNLIFPPYLGLTAGEAVLPAFLGFAVSAVGLPILAVIAVAGSGGFRNIAGRVGKHFAPVFILLTYLAIGPGLAIPRTASTSFEMAVVPFVPADAPLALYQALYTAVFFAAALTLALRPSQLVDWLGKRLAPALLTLIAVLFVGCLLAGGEGAGETAAAYQSAPLAQGFLDGYQTMDAIAGLIFGLVLAMNIRAKGVTENDAVVRSIWRASGLAAALFLTVYGALTFIGSVHGAPDAQNGAQLLSGVARDLFGTAGGVIIAAIFVIACLNTCISLTCCCAEYFHTLFPKVSYTVWACFFAVASAVVSNAGLNLLLEASVPILNCLYPAAIVMIALSFLPKRLQDRRLLFPLSVGLAAAFGVLHTLSGLGLRIPLLTALAEVMPLYAAGVGWLVPALMGAVVALAVPARK